MRAREAAALAALAVAAAALARSRARRFARLHSDPPADTQRALDKHRWHRLRHAVVKQVVPARELERVFGAIRAAFAPQQVEYSNSAYDKNHWSLSCFMEYTNGVAAGKVDLSMGLPMLEVVEEILTRCDAAFSAWYDELHPFAKAKGASRSLVRLQSFVTRYLPRKDETHLPRHIDGADVDGSLVLGLPTYYAYRGGGLTVWDGENDAEEFVYPVGVGDACVMDARVWHQSNPILEVDGYGERWVIVIFYKVITIQPKQREPELKIERSQVVRQLLARRLLRLLKGSLGYLSMISPLTLMAHHRFLRIIEAKRCRSTTNQTI